MTEEQERFYERGMQGGYRELLGIVLRGLLVSDPDGETADVAVARLAIRETTTREALRSICEEFGDNDWPDDLSFADVLEKHLARHLREGEESDG
jgi:hypothetical protein